MKTRINLLFAYCYFLLPACSEKPVDYSELLCKDVNSANYGQIGDCVYDNETSPSVLFVVTHNNLVNCGDSVFGITNTLDSMYSDDLEIIYLHVGEYYSPNNRSFISDGNALNPPVFFINGNMVTSDLISKIGKSIEFHKNNPRYKIKTMIAREQDRNIFKSTAYSLVDNPNLSCGIAYYLIGDSGIVDQKSRTNKGYISAEYDSSTRSYIDVIYNNISMGASSNEAKGYSFNEPNIKGHRRDLTTAINKLENIHKLTNLRVLTLLQSTEYRFNKPDKHRVLAASITPYVE